MSGDNNFTKNDSKNTGIIVPGAWLKFRSSLSFRPQIEPTF